jgi:outer membrane protein insertion porin family
MRLQLLSILTIVAFSQVANPVIAGKQFSQIERSIVDRNLTSSTHTAANISLLLKPGILKQVRVKTLPANTSSAIAPATIDEIFQAQYGKQLNEIQLKAAIEKLNQLYQQQGYNLSQVVSVAEIDGNGQLILTIAEGTIEEVQVRFMNRKGETVDENKQPITSKIPTSLIISNAELQPGVIYNRKIAERDVRRIYNLGLFDDVHMSLAPARDRSKVIIRFDLTERKQ